jgi:hypothetical protein
MVAPKLRHRLGGGDPKFVAPNARDEALRFLRALKRGEVRASNEGKKSAMLAVEGNRDPELLAQLKELVVELMPHVGLSVVRRVAVNVEHVKHKRN